MSLRPNFYGKLGSRDEAISNLQSAIELQRYDTELAAERFDEVDRSP